MRAKTKAADLLPEIQKTWSDLLKLQEALNQLQQFSAIPRLSAVATEIASFIAERAIEDAHREKAEKKIRTVLQEAARLIRQAEELIAKSEGRGQKPARAKRIRTAPSQKVMRLAPRNGKILENALAIFKGEKDDWHPRNWDTLRNNPVAFVAACFGDQPIYVLGQGKIPVADYISQGFFAQDLRRIVERYQEYSEGQFMVPVNEQTRKLFEQVRTKISSAMDLQTMFETMLGKPLDTAVVQTAGAEDQKSD